MDGEIMNGKRKWIAGSLLLSLNLLLCSGEIYFIGDTNRNPLQYRSGEPMKFTISLVEDGVPKSGIPLKWKRRGDDGRTEEGTAVSDASKPLVIRTSIGKPGFVRILVDALDANGVPLKGGHGFQGGAGADVGKLESLPEPADFDAFWIKQKKRLSQIPMKTVLTPIPSERPGFKVFEFSVNGPGKLPSTGYICMKSDAKPKSLPLCVLFPGYGPVGSVKPNFHGARNAIAVTVNSFGLPNGKDAKFYRDCEKQFSLKGYGFNGNENPETSFLNAMLLRDLRALEYVKTLPEWNGKELKVIGASMGALRSITMSAQDRDVTSCYAGIPWLADLSGITFGRQRGWRPNWVPALGYYDIVNQARRVQCRTEVSICLGDYTCPPSGEMIFYKNLHCEKTLTVSQNGTHGYIQPNAKRYHFKGNIKEEQ